MDLKRVTEAGRSQDVTSGYCRCSAGEWDSPPRKNEQEEIFCLLCCLTNLGNSKRLG